MNRSYPRLRPDIKIRGFQPELDRFLLEDPLTGRAFMFKEREYTIIQQCSGCMSIDAIAEVAFRALGSRMPNSAIQRFIQRLDDLGLLELDAIGKHQHNSSTASTQGDTSQLRWQILFLRSLAGIFFETKVGAIPLGITFMLMTRAVARRDIYNRDAETFLSPSRAWSTVGLIYLCLPIIALIHELGHILAIVHFTGKLFRIQVQLRRLKITVNVPSAEMWHLNRTQRICIALAGVYSQLILLGMVLTAWRSPKSGSLLRQLCLALSIPLASSSVTNLMPSLPGLSERRTDGYFAVSYLTGMPNLAARAQEYGAWVRQQNRDPAPPSLASIENRHLFLAIYYFAVPWMSLLVEIGYFASLRRFLTQRRSPSRIIISTAMVMPWFTGQYRPVVKRLITRVASSGFALPRFSAKYINPLIPDHGQKGGDIA